MNTNELKVAKSIAPEDLRPGRYVAVLYEICEILPFGVLMRETPGTIPATVKPVRVAWLPCDCDECKPGQPLKVIAVCLPFVLIEDAQKKQRAIDTRRLKLARVSKSYALEYIEGVRQAVVKKNRTPKKK